MRRLIAPIASMVLAPLAIASASPSVAPSSSASATARPSASARPSTSASASASGSIKPLSSVAPSSSERIIAPDPTPLPCDAVLVLSVRYDKGTIRLEKVRREAVAKGTTLPRRFGRFAAELYVGPTLLERARFDFPLIHDDDAPGAVFGKTLDFTVEVRVPDSDRPTRLEIWDRASDKRWIFRYPPPLTP